MSKKFLIFLAIILTPVMAYAAFQWNGAAITVLDGASITAWNGASLGGSTLWDGAGNIPITDSHCVAAYYMNATGDETDRSTGGTETLTQGGTFDRSTTLPTGFSGYSRIATSAGDNLSHANGGTADLVCGSNGGNGSFTFCAWVKIYSDPSANQYLWSNYNNVTDDRQYRMYFDDTNDYWRWDMSPTGTTTVVTATGTTNRATLSTNWHWMCFEYDNSTGYMTIYIDNVSNGSIANASGCTQKSGSYYLGTFRDGTLNIDSYVDEPIWFNIALSSAQRADIMTNGISGNKGASD